MPLDVEKLEQLRDARKLTQQQAAEACGLTSKSHWWNVVHRKQDVTVTQLEAMAKFFKVPVNKLLTK